MDALSALGASLKKKPTALNRCMAMVIEFGALVVSALFAHHVARWVLGTTLGLLIGIVQLSQQLLYVFHVYLLPAFTHCFCFFLSPHAVSPVEKGMRVLLTAVALPPEWGQWIVQSP